MSNIDAYPQFYNLVNSRYSCRAYSPEPVSREMVLAVLDTARLAPSACNKQPWIFIAVTEQEQRAKVAAAYGRDWVNDVPVFIVACGVHSQAWHRADGKDHTDIDIAIAVEHICLGATSLGLASCWICNFDAAALAKSLELPEGTEPIAIIPLGYARPGAETPRKQRKPMEEILRWEKF